MKIFNCQKLAETLHWALLFFRPNHKSWKQVDKKSSSNIFITEVLHHSDQRIQTDKAEEARRVEIENLVRRGTWVMIPEKDGPEDAKVISGSYFITTKDIEIEKLGFKASFAAHGNKYSEKNELISNSATARQSSVILPVALAAIMLFDAWTEDVSQAYLQSESELLRAVYLGKIPSYTFQMDSYGSLIVVTTGMRYSQII